jgi:hypothetical protein
MVDLLLSPLTRCILCSGIINIIVVVIFRFILRVCWEISLLFSLLLLSICLMAILWLVVVLSKSCVIFSGNVNLVMITGQLIKLNFEYIPSAAFDAGTLKTVILSHVFNCIPCCAWDLNCTFQLLSQNTDSHSLPAWNSPLLSCLCGCFCCSCCSV